MTAIGGPTGAFVVVVAGIIGQYGVNGLFLCTMMAGIILIAPRRVGRRVGRQIHSASRRRWVYQRHRRADREHAAQRFFRPAHRASARSLRRAHARRRRAFRHDLRGRQPRSASRPFLTVVATPRVLRRVPGTIVAMFGVSIAAIVMALPVETIGTRFGGVPSGLAADSIPVHPVVGASGSPHARDDRGHARRDRVACCRRPSPIA